MAQRGKLLRACFAAVVLLVLAALFFYLREQTEEKVRQGVYLIQQFDSAFSQRNMEQVDQLFSADAVFIYRGRTLPYSRVRTNIEAFFRSNYQFLSRSTTGGTYQQAYQLNLCRDSLRADIRQWRYRRHPGTIRSFDAVYVMEVSGLSFQVIQLRSDDPLFGAVFFGSSMNP